MNDNMNTESEILKNRIRELEQRISACEANAAELLRNNRFYRMIADFTYDWVYWLKPDGSFRYVSQSCEKITGYSSDAFFNDPKLYQKIIHKDDLKGVMYNHIENMTEEKHPPINFRITTASGEERWISHSCVPIFDEVGKFLGRRGSNHDITEQKSAEEALQISETRYKAMFDGMTTCVAVYKAVSGGNDFVFVDFNRAAEMSSQISRYEIIGKSVREVFPGVCDMGLFDVFKRVYSSGLPEKLPVSHYEDNRIMLWAENYVYKLPSGEIVALYDDQTTEKKAEDTLRIQEERLKLALEATSDALWDWNIKTGDTYFSPRFFTMLGHDPNIFPQDITTWDFLVHPDDGEEAKKIMSRRTGSDKPVEAEFRLRNKNGEWHWVLARGRVMETDGEGNPKRMVGTIVDIHERNLMLEKLKHRMNELETLNAMSLAAALNISLESVIQSAIDQMMESVNPDLVLIYLIQDGEMILKGFKTMLPYFDKNPELKHNMGDCLCGLAAESDAPVFSLNIHHDVRCTDGECKRAGITSFASMPLLSRGMVIGVIGLGSVEMRDFSQRQFFLQSLTALVSTGIANAKLHERVRSHANELEVKVEKRTAELKKFKNAVEHSPASIVITDTTGAIEYVNPFFTKLTGYTLEEAKGHNPRILKSGLHEAAFYIKMWETLLKDGSWRGEICNRKKNGEMYWEDISISSLTDESGNIQNYVAVKEDVTEKKLSEKALYESEQRYKTVFNATRDGIVISDVNTKKIRYVNESACKMLGYGANEILNLSIQDVHPKNDFPKILKEFEEMSLGRKAFSMDLPCLKKDGRILYCDISVTPVIIDENACLMGFFRDVSERREASDLRDNIDKIMRHDLKTPLNSIIGYSQLLIDSITLADQFKNYLKNIEKSGRYMSEMIDQYLDILKMESGHYTLTPVPVDIMETIHAVCADLESEASSKSIRFVNSYCGRRVKIDDKAVIKGEKALCYSILANLIKNAVEASPPKGNVTIDLNITNENAVIDIHNHGAVPNEIRGRFFEKYVTWGKKKGTGLGGYSAKLMADIQGGGIVMRTSEETGTVVTLRLPM